MKKLNRKIFLSACVATFVASSAMAIEPSNPIPGTIEDSQLTHLGGGGISICNFKTTRTDILY